MRRIMSFMRQDIATALRDNLIVYMIIAPLLISFGMKMFLPSVEKAGLSFIVEENVSQQVIVKLEEYGDIELLKTEAAVQQRVEKIDSAVGILEKDQGLTILFEGNEPPELIELYKTIVEQVSYNQQITQVTHRSLGKRGSILNEILTISMLMMAMLIGGIVSGFNIVAERDTKAINAIAVSPITTKQFIVARGVLASVLAIMIATGTSLIMMGSVVNYVHLITLLALSSLLTTLMGLIIGALATNQIGAIAVIKLLTPLYIGLPMFAFFIPDKFRFLFYWLPNYWQFQALGNIYFSFPQRFSFWNSTLLTFVLSGIYIIIFGRLIGKKLKLR